jgi:hypothetical protein
MAKQSSGSNKPASKKTVSDTVPKKAPAPKAPAPPTKRSNATGKDDTTEKRSRGTGAKELK